MKFIKYAFYSFFSVLLLLGFQNCGDGFESFKNGESLSSTNENNSTLPINEDPPEQLPEYMIYIQPNLINNCFTNEDYNACIFWKNPVAQQNSAFSTQITDETNLANIQTHAVNVLGTDQSGFLRNSTINVTTSTGIIVNSPDLNFKYPYSGTSPDTQQAVQVMVYHWMQSFISFMTAEAGNFHAIDTNIAVDAVAQGQNNAFYRRSSNSIQLGNVDGSYFGLNGEIIVHELGHANHRHASAITFSSTGTQSCPSSIGGTCCLNGNNGCGRAFAEGVSDYMYTLIFPTDTAGGQTLTNDLMGPSRCGLNRDINDNINLTLDNIGCSNIHMLGLIYAGIWNEVRKQVQADEPLTGSKNINILFNEHLLVLLNNESWTSAFNKIIVIDQELYQGRYAPFFQAEFIRRGISLN